MWNKHMQGPISINLGYTRAGRRGAARAHFLSVERSNDKHLDEVRQRADSSLELSIRGPAVKLALPCLPLTPSQSHFWAIRNK